MAAKTAAARTAEVKKARVMVLVAKVAEVMSKKTLEVATAVMLMEVLVMGSIYIGNGMYEETTWGC